MVEAPRTPAVQVTKGTGPDQLTQGDAKLQNDEAARATELAKGGEQAQTAESAVTGQLPANPPQPLGTDATSSFLYGPTKRPGEPVTRGLNRSRRPAIQPAAAQQWLGLLEAMANDTTAPPAVRALHALLANMTRG